MEEKTPVPIVKKPILRKHGGIDQGVREGRGFSRGELEAVGLDFKKALKLGLRIDKRRKSVHEWNIKALKEYLEKLREKGVRI
ncbi:MAG: 50S ribosomal protein L13e [Desulfurococcales archaeon ex4484_58]|nr:MAG: 50S ribosomal protein L13e [Desulfurococcales archaeon ex4484_58]